MELYSGHINKLIEELAGLPGIGSKSAQRLAFHLINMPKARVERLAHAIVDAKENVRYCEECYTLTDKEMCPVCANVSGDHGTIMVVENARDLAAYEKTVSTAAFITYCMARFLLCSESHRMILNSKN